jgi:hypothetical protein
MLSKLDGTHERSITLVDLRRDEMLLPLRPEIGEHIAGPGGIGAS